MKRYLLAALVAATALSAAPAVAAPVVYTVSGNFSGILGGQDFTTDAVFTGTGDTDKATKYNFGGFDYDAVTLTSLTANANGTTYTFSNPFSFFSGNNPNPAVGSIFGFADLTRTADQASLFTVRGGAVTFPEANGTFNVTPGETVRINAGSNITLSTAVAAVPEPSTWAMMMVGMAGVGLAMRRRRVSVVRFA